MTPGNLESEASTLEEYHGTLAQERRQARIRLENAHRAPRTERLDDIVEVWDNLIQLPAVNLPLHKGVYNATKESHDYLEE